MGKLIGLIPRGLAVRLVGSALIVIAIGAVIAGCGSSGAKATTESAAEEAEAEREVAEISGEVAEAEQEVAEEASDPHTPHGFEEMVIAHPDNEGVTSEQIATQIQTNMESQDPTHQQEASCTIGTSYRDYSHFLCIAYTLGGQAGMSQVEVTVNKETGEVSAELVEP